MMRWSCVLLLLATGCGGALSGAAPVGRTTWTEVRGEHFVVQTDVAPEYARGLLVAFEDLRAALLSAIAPSRLETNTGRIPVIVLRDREEWNGFFRGPVDAVFVSSALYRPAIVLYLGGAGRIDEVIQHELTHYLSRFVISEQPLWFAEGLAGYFQTLDVDRARRSYVVGRSSAALRREVQRNGVMPIDALFRQDASTEPSFYASAWAVVHYLFNREPERFLQYQDMTIHGVEHDVAWRTVFPDLPPPALHRAVTAYVHGGRYVYRRRQYDPPEVTAVERTLPDAEVHWIRAHLRLLSTRVPGGRELKDVIPDATRDLDAALAADPTLPAALLLRASLEPDRLSQLAGAARAAVSHHPGDWMAWLTLAATHAATDLPAAQGALARALELAAADPAVTVPPRLKELAELITPPRRP